VPGTSRYLILYRKSVEGEGKQGSHYGHLSLSPRLSDVYPLPRMPFHLDELPFPHPRRPFHELVLPLFPPSLYIRPHVVPSRIPRARGGCLPWDVKTSSLCRRRFSGRNWNTGINVSQLEIRRVAELADEQCGFKAIRLRAPARGRKLRRLIRVGSHVRNDSSFIWRL